MKKKYVFSKGEVRNILRAVADEVRSLKSPKAIVEILEARANDYMTSGRGRRVGPAIDLTALQAVVDQTATETLTTDGNRFSGVVALNWNRNIPVKELETTPLMDPQKIKKYALAGKLQLPTAVVFQTRQRRAKPEQSQVVS
jgi:hypothetical protein